MQHLGMRDWDPDFEQIVLLYKPFSKCPRQQHNMDGASIGFVWPARAHGRHVRGKLAGQSMMGMGSMECLVQMGLRMIRWPNGRSEPLGTTLVDPHGRCTMYWFTFGWVLVRSNEVLSLGGILHELGNE